jgi:hypothetical protein
MFYSGQMSRTFIVWIVAALVALGALLWGATFFWQGLGSGLSGHGWFAYILGGVLTLGLSAGLFALSFYSARHGHDDIDPPAGS